MQVFCIKICIIQNNVVTLQPILNNRAAMVESVDTKDLKSFGQKWLCGFKSHSRYKRNILWDIENESGGCFACCDYNKCQFSQISNYTWKIKWNMQKEKKNLRISFFFRNFAAFFMYIILYWWRRYFFFCFCSCHFVAQ